MSWVVPPRVQEKLAILDAAASVSSATAPSSAVVEALGALCIAGASDVARERAHALPAELTERAQVSLEVAVFCDLLDELFAFVAAEPPEDGAAEPSWVELGRSVLDERHRLELLLRGAALLAPDTMAVDAEVLDELQEADERLRRQMWRLTILNDHRRERLGDVAPGEREAIWWYSWGVELPAAAVTHVSDVAAVLATFPEAAKELHALEEGERLLRAETRWSSAVLPKAESVAAVEPVVAAEPAETERHADDFRKAAFWAARPQRLTLVFGTLGAVVAAVFVAGGMAFMGAASQAEKEKALLHEELERVRKETDAQVKQLENSLKNKETMSAAQRLALEEQLEEARAKAASAAEEPRPVGRTNSASRASRPLSKPSGRACAPGDPLCSD